MSHINYTHLQADVTEPNQTFEENEQVVYTDSEGVEKKATVLKVHLEDVDPYYTIRLWDTGKERQTQSERLRKTYFCKNF